MKARFAANEKHSNVNNAAQTAFIQVYFLETLLTCSDSLLACAQPLQ